MFRGIISTIYLDLKKKSNVNKISKYLTNFYKKDNFIKILKPNTLLSTNDVINTNYCYISVCKSKYKNKIIVLSAIDNLIKGGTGQAVQNLNILFNFKHENGFNMIKTIIIIIFFYHFIHVLLKFKFLLLEQ